MKTIFARCATLLLVLAAVPAWADVCRVTTTGTADNDGSGWDNGHALNLQGALGKPNCTEVWVAKGVYKPVAAGGDRNASFNVPPNAKVYGGFAGTEGTLAARVLSGANPSVLSGDIDNNDTVDANGVDIDTTKIQGGNSCHVVWMDGTGSTPITGTTVLDGFTITGGNADASCTSNNGGGLYCNGGGGGKQCSPTLSQLAFRGNRAKSFGGAIQNDGQSGGTSSPTISRSTFSGNYATYGGAISNQSDHGNTSPSISQSTFAGNTAVFGGAIHNNEFGSNCKPTISHSTFSANSAAGLGGAIYSFGFSYPNLSAVILWGNTAQDGPEIAASSLNKMTAITDSIVQGGCPTVGTCNGTIITTDPNLGALADNGGPTQTLLPGNGSAAIDVVACPVGLATDQRGTGYPRPQGPRCDIGAVEVREFALTLAVGANGSASAAATPLPNGPAIANCTNATCTAQYSAENAGTPLNVGLAAAPAAGYAFAGWGGDCSGAGLNATVTMNAAHNCSASFSAFTIAPTTLPSGMLGTAYSQTLSAMGGVNPISFTVTAGSALPTGLTLTAGGVLSGTPAAGAFNFSVTATDTNGSTTTRTYSIAIQPATQTLTFGAAPTLAVGTTGPVSVTSATPHGTANIVLISTTPSVCTLSDISANANVASATAHGLGKGTCTIAADQAETANYTAAERKTQSVTVSAPAGTILTLNVAPNPAIVGQLVTLTVKAAEVSPTSALTSSFTFTSATRPVTQLATPQGSVRLSDNGSLLTTLTLDASGQASYATATLAAGPHSFVADYQGNDGATAQANVSLTIVASIATAPTLSLLGVLSMLLAIIGLTRARRA